MRLLDQMDSFLKERPEGLFATIPCNFPFIDEWMFSRAHYLRDSMRYIGMVLLDKRTTHAQDEQANHLASLEKTASRLFLAAKTIPVEGSTFFETRGDPTFIGLCNDLSDTRKFLLQEREELTATCRAGQRRIGATLNPVLENVPQCLQLLLGGHSSFRLIEAQDHLTTMAGNLGAIRTGMLRIIAQP